MSSRRQSAGAVISRAYKPEPAACASALELLLKSNRRSEKGGPATAQDDRKGFKDDPATARIPL